MKPVEIGESGPTDVLEADLAGGFGPPELAPDLVARLLAEGREEGVEVGALGQRS